LEQLGYNLSPQLQDLLKRKYGAGLSFEYPMSSAHCSRFLNLDVNWVSAQAPAEGGPAAALPAGHSTWSGITFDRFVRACTVVKQLNVSFDALDRDPYGNVRIDYDAFVKMVFKLP
jgi:peflin